MLSIQIFSLLVFVICIISASWLITTKSFGQESANQFCPEEGDGLAGKLGKNSEAINKIEKNLTGQSSSAILTIRVVLDLMNEINKDKKICSYCQKCGKKLDPSKEIPLCNDCERIHD